VTIDQQFILDESVEIKSGAFPLGASMALVDPDLRLRDHSRRLDLAGLLDSTPYHWVYLDKYRIGRTMVTNGQYLQFLNTEGTPYEREDCWRYVWAGTGRHIESHARYDQAADGKVHHKVELHSDARNFVEAYIDSLNYEVTQWSEFEDPGAAFIDDDSSSSSDGTVQLEAIDRSRTIRRVFDFAKSCLSDAIVPANSDDDVLLPKAQQDIQLYFSENGAEALRHDISSIRKLTVQRLSVQVPPLMLRKLQRSPHEIVEAIAFLRRLHKAWVRLDMPHKLKLRDVLYPRSWPSHEGEVEAGGFGIPTVPWADRPVFGITLYEATAFCTWLSQLSDWKLEVDLPSEAQYERAASWSNEHPESSGGRVRLDPKLKALFPWQEHCEKDFNDLFGQEQMTLDKLYANPKAHDKQLEESSRSHGDSDRIGQLLGFGWQWCADRFDTAERRYARFHPDTYEKQPDLVVEDMVAQAPQPVWKYSPNSATQHSNFVVRGAPEILGGPGLTTRRFAMFPLRAYPNVGFRWICTTRGEQP
jgi:formylglycine-generating enzyme required for sulfatase activity